MATLFVVSDKLIDNHVGEEYDYILEVPHIPTVENIDEIFNRMRVRIRSIWEESKGVPSSLRVVMDAAQAIAVAVVCLRDKMLQEEGISFEVDI